MDLAVADLRGYRWWRLTSLGWLKSPWRGYRWITGANAAECRRLLSLGDRVRGRGRERCCVPSATCGCGFYALHRPTRLTGSPSPAWEVGVESSGRDGLVFGVARASGRTLVGTEGWRTEIAQVLALYAEQPSARGVRRAGRRYAIPVYGDLGAFIAEWGPDGVADELIGSQAS